MSRVPCLCRNLAPVHSGRLSGTTATTAAIPTTTAITIAKSLPAFVTVAISGKSTHRSLPVSTQSRPISYTVTQYPYRMQDDGRPLSPLTSSLSHDPRPRHDYQSVENSIPSNGQSNPSSHSPISSGRDPQHNSENDKEGDKGSVPQIPDQAPPAHEPSNRRLVVAGVAFTVLVVGGIVAASTGVISKDSLISLTKWFETLGPEAVVLYGALYFVLELLAVPALPLTLGAGYLFGVLKGTISVSISSSLAAGAAFLIARYGLRDTVTSLARRYPRFRAIDRAIGREGFKFVFLLRLSPLLPFSISNYLYGLTSVNFTQFFIASWLGMLPGTIAYVSAGAAVSALADLESNKVTHVNPALVVVGVIGTVGALWFAGRLASRAIADINDNESVSDESEDPPRDASFVE